MEYSTLPTLAQYLRKAKADMLRDCGLTRLECADDFVVSWHESIWRERILEEMDAGLTFRPAWLSVLPLEVYRWVSKQDRTGTGIPRDYCHPVLREGPTGPERDTWPSVTIPVRR